MKSEIPTLSKTSVYNTLAIFKKKKVDINISVENVFGSDLSQNGHFKCEKCDNVTDFNVKGSDLNIKELQGFDIKQSKHYFNGICKNCS